MRTQLVRALIWTGVLACAAIWSLGLFAPELPSRVVGPPALQAEPPPDLRRAISAPMPVSAPPVNLVLVGVVAESAGAGGGIALIAVGANPARVYRVGAVVHGDSVLQSVAPSAALLGRSDGATTQILKLSAGGGGPSSTPLALPAGAPRPWVRNTSADGDSAEASPIVPPQPDMVTPRASEAVAPGAWPFPPRDGASAAPGV